jgi:signal peptidase S26 family
VPPDSFFALGDNRDASYDCRYYGFIPSSNIFGRASVIYFSFDPKGAGPLGSGALAPNRPEAFERSRVSGECEELH